MAATVSFFIFTIAPSLLPTLVGGGGRRRVDEEEKSRKSTEEGKIQNSAAAKQQQKCFQQEHGRPGGRPSAEAGARSTGPVDRGAQTCTMCAEGWRSTGAVDRRKGAVDRASTD